MTIHLQNTKTRRKEPFKPINRSDVRMYVCGPTVYDRAHIGNARPVVVFDLLFRLLRHHYGDDAVTYVRNFTDVDDKINAKALETKQPDETLVEAVRRITDETIGWYHEDMDSLGALRPTHEPRATEYIPQMVAMGEDLIKRGHAYEAEGHVLFEARTDPDYGSLSRRPLDEMQAGARVEVAPFKRDPMDSVIWKPSTDEQPGWDSPWGRGRPGWHIECSAMAGDLLGSHFDIHGGGIDLQFPHHENECAQSRCVGHDFANVWMHNGYLMVEGEKMSKSLGNFVTVADLREQGVPGEVIRLAMLTTHYRSPIDWTEKAIEDADKTLRKWRSLVDDVEKPLPPHAGVLSCLRDDLNTPKAISWLHMMSNPPKGNERDSFRLLRGGAMLLGLLTDDLGGWTAAPKADGDVADQIDRMLAARATAKAEKDFAKADGLRAALVDAGVEVQDGPGGAEWSLTPGFDATKLVGVEELFDPRSLQSSQMLDQYFGFLVIAYGNGVARKTCRETSAFTLPSHALVKIASAL